MLLKGSKPKTNPEKHHPSYTIKPFLTMAYLHQWVKKIFICPGFCKYKYLHIKLVCLAIVKSSVTIVYFCAGPWLIPPPNFNTV